MLRLYFYINYLLFCVFSVSVKGVLIKNWCDCREVKRCVNDKILPCIQYKECFYSAEDCIGEGSYAFVFPLVKTNQEGDGGYDNVLVIRISQVDADSFASCRVDAIKKIRELSEKCDGIVYFWYKFIHDCGDGLSFEFLPDLDPKDCAMVQLMPKAECDLSAALHKKLYLRCESIEEFMFSIMDSVVKGAAALEENNIVHRDIKPCNILMTFSSSDGKKPVVKACLSDFDLSILKNDGEDYATCENGGSSIYRSPENRRSRYDLNYFSQADSWAIGMTCLAIITRGNDTLLNGFCSDYDRHTKEHRADLDRDINVMKEKMGCELKSSKEKKKVQEKIDFIKKAYLYKNENMAYNDMLILLLGGLQEFVHVINCLDKGNWWGAVNSSGGSSSSSGRKCLYPNGDAMGDTIKKKLKEYVARERNSGESNDSSEEVISERVFDMLVDLMHLCPHCRLTPVAIRKKYFD